MSHFPTSTGYNPNMNQQPMNSNPNNAASASHQPSQAPVINYNLAPPQQAAGGPIRRHDNTYQNNSSNSGQYTSSNYKGNNSYHKRISDVATTAGRALSDLSVVRRDVKFLKEEIGSVKAFLQQLFPNDWEVFEARSAGNWAELDRTQRDMLTAEHMRATHGHTDGATFGSGDSNRTPRSTTTTSSLGSGSSSATFGQGPSTIVPKPTQPSQPTADPAPAPIPQAVLLKAIAGLNKKAEKMEEMMRMIDRAELVALAASADEEDEIKE